MQGWVDVVAGKSLGLLRQELNMLPLYTSQKTRRLLAGATTESESRGREDKDWELRHVTKGELFVLGVSPEKGLKISLNSIFMEIKKSVL